MNVQEPLLQPQPITLLALVQQLIQDAANDEEVVTTIALLVNSGQVQLCGSFAGAKIILPP